MTIDEENCQREKGEKLFYYSKNVMRNWVFMHFKTHKKKNRKSIG